MAAFPYYDAAAIAALNGQAQALLDLFAARGYGRQEPSVLQPAGLFLDRSGEEIRRRTFTLADPSGRDLALRPDLTIPICRQAVETHAVFPARICYNGLVFRHQPNEPTRPTQFFQAGVELLGLDSRAAGDAEVLSLAVEALRSAGVKDFEIKVGDLGLYGALVDALDVPPQWRARLKRHFWRSGYVETLLYRLGHGGPAVQDRARIEAMLDAQADAPLAGRTRAQIVARVLERSAEAANLRLDPAIADVIPKLFAIQGPAGAAMTRIRDLLSRAGIRLEAQLAAMEARLRLLEELGVKRVTMQAHFGRNMEYYTGFVFEFWSRDTEGAMQIAGGGRYDNLLEMLGAKSPVSAIGCAIRTERVLAARRLQGGG